MQLACTLTPVHIPAMQLVCTFTIYPNQQCSSHVSAHPHTNPQRNLHVHKAVGLRPQQLSTVSLILNKVPCPYYGPNGLINNNNNKPTTGQGKLLLTPYPNHVLNPQCMYPNKTLTLTRTRMCPNTIVGLTLAKKKHKGQKKRDKTKDKAEVHTCDQKSRMREICTQDLQYINPRLTTQPINDYMSILHTNADNIAQLVKPAPPLNKYFVIERFQISDED